MKLIIAGGRDFDSVLKGQIALMQFHIEHFGEAVNSVRITEIVSGGARGADAVGEKLAWLNNIPVKKFIPDWDGLGKRAGFVRNAEMADYADALLAFWDGSSKGTAHMIDIATKKGLIVKVVRY